MEGTDDIGRTLDARLRDAAERLDLLEARLAARRSFDRPEPVEPEPVETEPAEPEPAEPEPVEPASGHILFVPSAGGYVLVERDGELPATGQTIELPDRDESYAVTKVVRSPLPGDRRPCAYLQLT